MPAVTPEVLSVGLGYDPVKSPPAVPDGAAVMVTLEPKLATIELIVIALLAK